MQQIPSSWLFFIGLLLLLPLPLGTDQRRRRFPWITCTLICINSIVFIIRLLLNASSPDQDFQRWGSVPGALQPVTLITSMFLHHDFAHLLSNMWFLCVFGPQVEDVVGRRWFSILYLAGGVVGGLLHVAIIRLASPNGLAMTDPLIGASGAISAILAPYALRFHRSNIRIFWFPGLLFRHAWFLLPSVTSLGLWLLYNVAGGVMTVWFPNSGGTAYGDHIGGFVVGFFLAEVAHLFRQGQQEYLLTDARGAATRGQDLLFHAIQKYRGFLAADPDNASIRAELARTLLQHAGQSVGVSAADRAEAGGEMAAGIRSYQNAGSIKEALALYAEAGDLRLPLKLATRELLRLANAALEIGELKAAETLFRTILVDMPEAPEAEMARLKLGQMLLKTDPAQAKSVLAGFLTRYPHSEWVRLVRDLRAEAERLTGEQE